MKKLLAFLLLSTAPAQAQYFSSPPAVLVNGTTAYASQVMTDLNKIISDGNTQFSAIAALVAGYTPMSVPSGMVLPFNSQTCPSGWTESNGAAGTVDLRGYFPRVWNSGGGPYDAGRVRNSAQADSLQDHTHYLNGTFASSFNAQTQHVSNTSTPFVTSASTTGSVVGNPASGSSGSETRPANVALTFCQKT